MIEYHNLGVDKCVGGIKGGWMRKDGWWGSGWDLLALLCSLLFVLFCLREKVAESLGGPYGASVCVCAC